MDSDGGSEVGAGAMSSTEAGVPEELTLDVPVATAPRVHGRQRAAAQGTPLSLLAVSCAVLATCGWAWLRLRAQLRKQASQLEAARLEAAAQAELLESAQQSAAARQREAEEQLREARRRAAAEIERVQAANKAKLEEVQAAQLRVLQAREEELAQAMVKLKEASETCEKLRSDSHANIDQHRQAEEQLLQAIADLQAMRGELEDTQGELGLTRSQMLLLRGDLEATKRQLRHAQRQADQAKLESRQTRGGRGADAYAVDAYAGGVADEEDDRW